MATLIYGGISSYVNLHPLNTDYEQSTEANNVKSTPRIAPGTHVSAVLVILFHLPFSRAAYINKLGNPRLAYKL